MEVTVNKYTVQMDRKYVGTLVLRVPELPLPADCSTLFRTGAKGLVVRSVYAYIYIYIYTCIYIYIYIYIFCNGVRRLS